ncbi:hypothetical protein JYU34_003648 [Plutella xylostella]|uniref:Uncharacterized protein n=1 Tax=Plutella xylostella TaxID=51655 RepID=A0ABQ7R0J8_PLUXY|nr:hypothetical protein JYU34_003648 [Plutella xylostella]
MSSTLAFVLLVAIVLNCCHAAPAPSERVQRSYQVHEPSYGAPAPAPGYPQTGGSGYLLWGGNSYSKSSASASSSSGSGSVHG